MTIRIWNIAHGTDNVHCRPNGNIAIRIKIISPAYILPNKRNANEIGLEIKLTNSKNKLNGIKNFGNG